MQHCCVYKDNDYFCNIVALSAIILMMPQTFEQWKHCIVNDCKINLTQDFANQRLKVYQDKQSTETQKFISLYGEQHLKNIIQWFNQI
jgi:hypothetical protein